MPKGRRSGRPDRNPLQRLREASGFTTAKGVADGHPQIAHHSLAHFERGARPLSFRAFVTLAGIYGCSLDVLHRAWQRTREEFIERQRAEGAPGADARGPEDEEEEEGGIL